MGVVKQISLGALALLLSQTVMADAVSGEDVHLQVAALRAQLAKLQSQLSTLEAKLDKPQAKKNVLHKKEKKAIPDNLFATAVTSTPTLGLRSSYDGSDLIVKFSQINEDLRLLKQRRFYNQHRNIFELHHPSRRPAIELSGRFDMAGFLQHGDGTAYSSDVDLDSFEVDVLTEVNQWVGAIASIRYDNGFGSVSTYDTVGNSADRVNNSRLYLKRGFVTIGQLEKSPWYLTAGQVAVPFGRYSSYMLTSPVTQRLGQSYERALLLGYDRQTGADEWQWQAYLAATRWETETHDKGVNQGGINAQYQHAFSKDVSLTSGAGVIYNIVGTDGLKSKLDSMANVSGGNNGTLTKQAPGFDVHTAWSYHAWRAALEYVSSIGTLHGGDFVTTGGDLPTRPRALHGEVNYKWGPKHVPASFSIGGGHSWGASYFTFPKAYWFANVGAHFWKNTLQVLEYRHNNRYDEGDDLFKDKLLFNFSVFF